MKHAPGNAFWKHDVLVGLKLLVRHQEVPSIPKIRRRAQITRMAHWVVTVMSIQGYYVLVRYEGMDDSSRDFWVHIGTNTVHPVGADVPNCVLVPPHCVYEKLTDWRTYLIENISGANTLPLDFQQVLRYLIQKCKYRVGDYLEVIDKYKISQLRIARVIKITGRRLHLRYIDDSNDGFYCHDQSALIHSLGWASCVGHRLQIPADYKLPTTLYDTSTKTSAIAETSFVYDGASFHQGMKLEAVDPLCPSRICAASICKVLHFGYMMLKMDCYDNYSPDSCSSVASNTDIHEENHWFCYRIDSPYIFKCGFCESNGIPLVPPIGHDRDVFNWNDYLKSNGLLAAPIPDQPEISHGFKVFMKLEMVDVMTPVKIHVGTVTQVAGRLLRINFDGWEQEFDQWVDAESPDIFPVGWCELVGHRLEPKKDKYTDHSTLCQNIFN